MVKKDPLIILTHSSDIAELNIIPTNFALKIAPSTGLRNILVHEYEDINDEIVYHSIGTCLEYYLEFLDLINQYLQCTEPLVVVKPLASALGI